VLLISDGCLLEQVQANSGSPGKQLLGFTQQNENVKVTNISLPVCMYTLQPHRLFIWLAKPCCFWPHYS